MLIFMEYKKPVRIVQISQSLEFNLWCLTYHDNDEIEPTPGVGEVFDKSQSQPFDTHLEKEDDREDSVHIV